MKKINQKGAVDLLLVVVLIVVLAVGGFVYYRIQSSNEAEVSEVNTNEVSQETQSEAEEIVPELETLDIGGATIQYDNSWVETQAPEGVEKLLIKTVGEKSYGIYFSKTDSEYLDASQRYGAAHAQNLKLHQEVKVDGVTNYVIISDTGLERSQKAYLSTCAPEPSKACSVKLQDGFLLINLASYAPAAQQIGGLDFSLESDKSVLDQFAEVAKTLSY